MTARRWFESDGPLEPVIPGRVWVGETIEPMRDGDTLVIRIGEPIVGVCELVRRAAEEWRDANVQIDYAAHGDFDRLARFGMMG